MFIDIEEHLIDGERPTAVGIVPIAGVGRDRIVWNIANILLVRNQASGKHPIGALVCLLTITMERRAVERCGNGVEHSSRVCLT